MNLTERLGTLALLLVLIGTLVACNNLWKQVKAAQETLVLLMLAGNKVTAAELSTRLNLSIEKVQYALRTLIERRYARIDLEDGKHFYQLTDDGIRALKYLTTPPSAQPRTPTEGG